MNETATVDSLLPSVYLSIFLVLLVGAAFFVFQQVLRTRRVEGQLAALQTKLSREKGTGQEYYELGGILLNKKLFSQAAAQFQQALRAGDLTALELPAVYNALGYTYFAQEQYDLAIRSYKDALKLSPNYVTALNNLGHAYERKQLIAQAVEVYDQALKIEPQNSTAKRRGEALKKRLPNV